MFANGHMYEMFGDCGRLFIQLHEKLKRTTDLRKPLKTLWHIHCVRQRSFLFHL